MKDTNTNNLIIIFGSPGCGKSTQSLLLEEKLGYKHISWGEITQNIINSRFGTEDDKRIVLNDVHNNSYYPEKYIKKNIAKIISEELKAGRNNFVVEGFPKRFQESKDCVEMIKELNLNLQCVINIACTEKTILERIKNAKYCEQCGKFYNDTIRPKNEGICDFDSGSLIKRVNNDPKTVRLEIDEYLHDITPAIELLSGISEYSFSINGDQDELLVFSDIVTKLKSNTKDIFSLFKNVGHALLPSQYGYFTMYVYQNIINYESHVVLTCGDISNKVSIPVRIHSSCITGDIFHSEKCDCGSQLDQAMSYIQKNGLGMIVYLFQEGRGINIINKVKAYDLQEKGFDTISANEFLGIPVEMRSYIMVKDILKDFNIKSIRLITNNPDKVSKILDLGVNVEDTIELESDHFAFNQEYLKIKVDKMMHSESLLTDKSVPYRNLYGAYLEVEKKYLVTKLEAELIEKKCLEMSLPLESYQYEKNQNFDRDGVFEKDDARLRLRTKVSDFNSHFKEFEFTYKKRLSIENDIKKETELSYSFESKQSSENLLSIFKITGLIERDSYERRRKMFSNKDVQFTIDEFPFGYIVEIEGDEDKVLEYEKLLDMGDLVQYGKSCDDLYAELCKKKNIEPKHHILFGDKDMPKLEDYIETWKK